MCSGTGLARGALVAATANRQSDPVFVGQVFARSSPILTWRPTLAKRVARDVAAEEIAAQALVNAQELSAPRISRAPTRRMVAWPVIRQVRGAPRAETIARRVALAVLALAAVAALAFAARAWGAPGMAQVSPPAARIAEAHVIDDGSDVIKSSAHAPVASAAPIPAKTPAPRPGHHGRRHTRSAAR